MNQPNQISRTRIKICGLTRPQDIACAVGLGVDALGFVFYPKSKRYLDPVDAGQLVADVPVFVSTVALFVEPDEKLVHQVIAAVRPTYLQFHGAESLKDCERYGLPYIKAFRVGAPGLDTPESLAHACAQYDNAKAWLFDSYTPSYGGSGHGFDRSLLAKVPKSVPMILSGGLNTENVATLLNQVQPWAIDVSSGVEIEPGVKSADRMHDFLQAVQAANNSSTPL